MARTCLVALLAGAAGYETLAVLSVHVSHGTAVALGIAVAMVVLVASLVVLAFARGRRGWAIEGTMVAALAGFLFWLAWDPAVPELAQPLGPTYSPEADGLREVIAKGFKGGAWESWPRLFDDESSLMTLSIDRRDPERYQAKVRESSSEIDAAWVRAGDARAWVDEVNGFAEISDFVTRFDSPILSFTNVRGIARIHLHRATDLALQGRGDEALDTIVPIAEFAGRLRRGGRALVTVMMAVVVEGMVIDTANLVLNCSETSGAARQRLADVLDDEIWDGRDLARAFRVEHDMTAKLIGGSGRAQLVDLMEMGVSEAPGILRPMLGRFGGRFVLNANSFCREHRQYMERVARCAEQLDGAGIEAAEAEIEARFKRIPPKNPAGALLMRMSVPALSKVEKNCRERLEQRRQLVDRLGS